MRCLPLVPALVLTLSMLLACGGDSSSDPNAGSIKARVIASGSPADPDGFTLVMTALVGNDLTSQYFKPEGETITFTGIPAGQYQVELQNVVENCAVCPSAVQTVQVIADATVDLAFTVTCSGG